MTASFLEMPAEWGRPEWLEHRRAGLGGSDVAAICGMSNFGSPMSVYLNKVGLVGEEPDNDNMKWGRILEPVIATEFTETTGLRVVAPQLLVVDDEHPWRRATLDGLVMETHATIEDGDPLQVVLDGAVLGTIQIKTTGDSSWHEIPDAIAVQCQYEMGVAGLTHCWLAVLHFGFGRHFEVYELEFDEVVYTRLTGIVDRFWEQNVLAENAPPVDSNPATTAALKDAFGERSDGSSVELGEPLVALAVEWLEAKAIEKDAARTVELIENRLRADLGESIYGSAVLDGDGLVELVSWKPQAKARHVDWKALRAEYPDVYEKFLSEPATIRVLRATKALKALAGVDA